MKLRSTLSLLLFFSFTHGMVGQDIITSRKSSPYTYVFRITNKEAAQVYKKSIYSIEDSYYHTLVDSIPTDSLYKFTLPVGHFLMVSSEGNKLNVQLKSIDNLRLKLVNNDQDLQITLYDSLGVFISDAKVSVNRKKIEFNKASHSYLLRKTNKKGLVSIAYHNHTTYFPLQRQYNNTWPVRTSKFILYKPPLKYLWIPLRDTYRTIRYLYPQGYIATVVSWFDSYPNNSRKADKYGGYIAFNKPAYKPGDTVKLKAFIIKKNYSPLNKEIVVKVGNYNNKYRELTKLNPTKPGAYLYEFILNDSIGLELDRTQYVVFEQKKGKKIIEDGFRYEDYELRSTYYSLKSNLKTHDRHQTAILKMKGRDENDLSIPDARVELTVLPNKLLNYTNEQVFIPDTLWHHSMQLEPVGETMLDLPDSIFPSASIKYTIMARFINSNNEWQDKTLDLTYRSEIKKIKIKLERDSVFIAYYENGKSVPHKADLYLTSMNDEMYHRAIPLPYKDRINPYASSYIVKDTERQEVFWVGKEDAGVSVLTNRTSDSVSFTIINERKLPIWYTVFAGKKEISRGQFSKNKREFKVRITTEKPYFVAYQYLWSGQIEEKEKKIPYYNKNLRFEVSQPLVVSPGQETDINITVTDQNGIPVPNVDLTAYAYSKSFGDRYQAPSVPYMGKVYYGRKTFNRFNKAFDKQLSNEKYLNYEKWHSRFGLDSIAYYQFLYPKNEIKRFLIPTPDNTTQFAPFVMDYGDPQKISIVYVNDYPVYFSGTDSRSNYSFKVEPDLPYRIRIRLTNKELILDSITFQKGNKTILSLASHFLPANAHIYNAPSRLTTAEKEKLQKYFILVDDNFGESFAYIKQYDKVQLLNTINSPYSNYRNNNGVLVGPFQYDSAQFVLMNEYKTSFMYEPMYEYQFYGQKVKMKSLSELKSFNPYLYSGSRLKNIGAMALTEDNIVDRWNMLLQEKAKKQLKYSNPLYTNYGKGRLSMQFSDSIKLLTLSISKIIFINESNPNEIRVYRPRDRTIENIEPGNYKLIFLLDSAVYFEEDINDLQANGTTYFTISRPIIYEKDSIIQQMQSIVNAQPLEVNYVKGQLDKDIRRIKQLAHFKYINRNNAFDHIVTGTVVSIDDGLSLPGVNVTIKGSTVGTVTDIDGNYILYVPLGSILTYSFIGLETLEVNVGSRSVVDVAMNSDVKQLSEVVVTAIGVSRKSKSLGYSVATVNQLSGVVAGVQIEQGPGAGTNIKIRGLNSITGNSNALIIVDGVPYNGLQSDLDPNLISNIKVLKSNEAIALYGASASAGVIIITTYGNNVPMQKGDIFNDANTGESSKHSVRNKFADYAYWEPNLSTDIDGRASFKVKFPDNVTTWRTFILGMEKKRYSGQYESTIKSFKSIMTNLSLPQYLISGDTTTALGKVSNYTGDTISVTTEFLLGNEPVKNWSKKVIHSSLDSIRVAAQEDSVKVTYTMQQPNGYFDGEERTLPVHKKGTLEAQGYFYQLIQDTTLLLDFNKSLGDIEFYLQNSALDIIENEANHLRKYTYGCNEQLASKLIAVLALKEIDESRDRKFSYQGQVKSIVKLLQKNQNEDGKWGWWAQSASEYWVTDHVINALYKAEQSGFDVNFDKTSLTQGLKWNLDLLEVSDKLSALLLLHKLDADWDFSNQSKQLAKQVHSLQEYIKLINLQIELGMKPDLDSLLSMKKETYLGNYYWEDNAKLVYDNSFVNTVAVSKIISQIDSLGPIFRKTKAYLIENRKNGHWLNTLESAKVIDAIYSSNLNDTLKNKEMLVKVNNKIINSFPYETTLSNGSSVELSYKGVMPLYVSAYQRKWIDDPEPVSKNIEVKTYFKKNSYLTAGKETKLFIEVNVKKKMDFINIEVPIPAGCSYSDKSKYYSGETHREYYKEKTNIYLRKLSEGKHIFEIKLMPRYSGSYTLNPARVESMYFPTYFGRNEVKRVLIK